MQELKQILEIQETISKNSKQKTLLGQLLIEQGICSPAMIHELVSEQTQTIEYHFKLLQSTGK